MALIRCPECEKEISDKAEKYPNCGYILKQRNNTMFFLLGIEKKLLLGLILILISGCLYGCGNKSKSEESNSDLSPEVQAALEQTEKLKEKVYAPYNNTVFADDSKMYELYNIISDASIAINDLYYLTRADRSTVENLITTKDIEDVKELIIFYYEEISNIYEEAYNELTLEQKPIQIYLENFMESLEAVKIAIDENRISLGIIDDEYDLAADLSKQRYEFINLCH